MRLEMIHRQPSTFASNNRNQINQKKKKNHKKIAFEWRILSEQMSSVSSESVLQAWYKNSKQKCPVYGSYRARARGGRAHARTITRSIIHGAAMNEEK